MAQINWELGDDRSNDQQVLSLSCKVKLKKTKNSSILFTVSHASS